MSATRKAIILAAILILTGCATAQHQAQEACDLYTELRPDVVNARAIIASGFDLYPPKTQEALKRIDARLPQLDLIGRAACGAADATAMPIDWKRAVAILREVAPVIVGLKQQGIF